MKKIGLTLGKYAPLHKGHQYIIERMLAENDEAVVIIYDTGHTHIPLPVRADWIRRLYPSVRVIEAWDSPVPPGWAEDQLGWTGRTEADGTGDIERAEIQAYEKSEEDYIIGLLMKEGLARKTEGTALTVTDITGFYSSEYYGAHMAAALGCDDVRVDEARKTVPVSSRSIRDDAYGHRQYVDPLVYRDLIVKAVFVGAMSTGKSTITEALAKRFGTTFAREYGRDYWAEFHRDRRIGLEEFDLIADRHQQIEEEAFREADRHCFVDTNAITTYMYSLDYHGKATKHLEQLALENASRYDLFFLCDDDIPYDDTWDRSGDAKRHVFHKQVVADLEMRRIPYIRLSGGLEERMKKVEETLAAYEPYRNFFGPSSAS